MTGLKRSAAVVLAVAYYGLFSVLNCFARLSAVHMAIFIGVSCFEYLGLEKFFCIELKDKPSIFKTSEFFLCALFIPLCLYVAAAAVRPDIFSCSASVCLAAFIFRSFYGAVKHIDTKGR